MRSVFLDTSVPLVAAGAESTARASCRAVMTAVVEGHLRLHLSVEAGQEFLFHRLRRVDPAAAVAQFDALEALAVWHPFDADVLRKSRDLVAAGHARGRDAVHAATALSAGFTDIVSCDPDFDGIPGLRRLDPARDPIG